MFSIVIATRDSERTLVPTLAALVPGATAGIVREVIIADGGSTDKTAEVADIAGCEFLSVDGSVGTRLRAAADAARGDWLMFLRPGAVPGPTWIEDLLAFTERESSAMQAAVFAAEPSLFGFVRRHVVRPRAEQGLALRKALYREVGGHRSEAADPEAALLRTLGRARLIQLRTIMHPADH